MNAAWRPKRGRVSGVSSLYACSRRVRAPLIPGPSPEGNRQIKRASAVFTLTQAGTSEPLGFARCAGDATRIAYVSDVYLAEHLQGQGLGRVFLQHVFDHGGRWRWRYLLHAEEGTARWYERAFGFTIVGRSPVSERIGREIMLCERLPLLEEPGAKVDRKTAADPKAEPGPQ